MISVQVIINEERISTLHSIAVVGVPVFLPEKSMKLYVLEESIRAIFPKLFVLTRNPDLVDKMRLFERIV